MNRKFLKWVALILWIVLSIPLLALTKDQPFQEVVRKSFTSKGDAGGGFIVIQKKVNHVEVCGDHCSYFEWKGDVNDERFWRFIVLYELNDEPGIDINEFKANLSTLATQDFIDAKFCTKAGSDISSVSCDWKSYSKSLGIVVGYANYDEGNRCSVQSIERDSAVLNKLKWKCTPMNPKESPFQ